MISVSMGQESAMAPLGPLFRLTTLRSRCQAIADLVWVLECSSRLVQVYDKIHLHGDGGNQASISLWAVSIGCS